MVEISREALLEPLRLISGAIERRQTLPILSNVLLFVDKNTIKMTATDSEIELTTHIALDQTIDLEPTTVPGKKMLDIVANLPENSSINIQQQESRLLIKSGRSRFSLSTLPAAEFPNIDQEASKHQFSFSQKQLKALLEKIYFAMANQDVRYYLNGLLFQIEGGQLTAVSTDGHRLAMAKTDIDDKEQSLRLIVPRKGVVELIRLLEDKDEDIAINVSDNFIKIDTANFSFISKLIEGKFPDYQRVIPKNNDKIVEIDANDLKKTLYRVSILSHQKARGIRLIFDDGLLKVSANNAENEEAEEEFSINYDGPTIEMGFNVGYLLDILNHIHQEKGLIRILLADASSSALFEPIKNVGSLYLVMPMRL